MSFNSTTRVASITGAAGATGATGASGSGSGDVVKVGTPLNNQVGVWTGDGTLEGVSTLIFDGTNLGIGAGSDPDHPLHVGTDDFIVKSDGKVGIGCTPTNRFSVQVGTDHRVGIWGSSTYSGIQSVSDDNSTFKDLRFDATEFWFIGGNVGIGTVIPSTALHVVGEITVAGDGNNSFTRTTGSYDALGSVLSLTHNTTGTPAAGLGSRMYMASETDTTPSTTQLMLDAIWTDVTHATRTSDLVIQLCDSGTLGEKFRFTGGGNLGIGTGTDQPATALHIAADEPCIRLEDENDGYDFDVRADGYGFNIREVTDSNAYRLTIAHSTGNVGIGTASPQNRCHIATGDSSNDNYRTGTDTPLIVEAPDGGGCYAQFVAGANEAMGIVMGTASDTARGGFLYDEDGGGAYIRSGGTGRMYVSTAGLVGIGTAAPSSDIGFAKILQITDANSVGIKFEATSYNSWEIGTGTSSSFIIADGGVGRVYVDTSGYVGIGASVPKTKLTVEGSVTLKEQAAADGDTAAYGQIWVKTGTPNTLYFTDDAGTDTQLGAGGGGGSGVTQLDSGTSHTATATANHFYTLSLAADDDFTLTLPAASAAAGVSLTFALTDEGNTPTFIVVPAGSDVIWDNYELINGSYMTSITDIKSNYEGYSLTLTSNGNDWYSSSYHDGYWYPA